MYTEYEATFTNIDKEEVRKRLRAAGAQLVRPEYMQKRAVFHLPQGHEIAGGWLRVRDEGDKITASLKIVDGKGIENQREICIEVDSFENAVMLFEGIGCRKKAYQETKRELWTLAGADITIDEWPFLEPFVEVEGASENMVREAAVRAGFDYSQALFCHVGSLYGEKYGFAEDVFNNQTPLLTFDMQNPFLGKKS